MRKCLLNMGLLASSSQRSQAWASQAQTAFLSLQSCLISYHLHLHLHLGIAWGIRPSEEPSALQPSRSPAALRAQHREDIWYLLSE